jgi:endonuclease/exonuclease/phosphatase family metal-dependent hydrolase
MALTACAPGMEPEHGDSLGSGSDIELEPVLEALEDGGRPAPRHDEVVRPEPFAQSSHDLPSDGVAADDPPLATQKATPTPYTVMSFNLRSQLIVENHDVPDRRWTYRRERAQQMVRLYPSNNAFGPDIIGFQEITQNMLNSMLGVSSPYAWHYVDRGDGSGNAVFVNANRFELVASAFRGVTNGERDGSCGVTDDEDPENRPIQRLRLRDKLSGRIVYVFNTHYPSKNSCERRGMTPIVRNYIAGRADTNSDVILVGDLNDGIESDGHRNVSYSDLLAETGLVSSFETKNAIGQGQYRSTNGFDPEARKGTLIDHILFYDASRNAATSKARVQSSFLDRTVFTKDPTVPSGNENEYRKLVRCQTISGGTCTGTGVAVVQTGVYSDHWAAVAKFTGK